MAVYEKSLILNDFTWVADGAQLFAGTFNDVAKYKVPAGQIVYPGSGAAGATDTRGILYISLQDTTPAQIEGKVRIELRDANETRKVFVLEKRTEELRGSKTDRNLAARLAQFMMGAKEDSYIVISVMPDSNATFSKANSDVLLPVTVKTV